MTVRNFGFSNCGVGDMRHRAFQPSWVKL